MRAIVCPCYGPPDVLRLEEVEKPTPRAHEVLVRVRARTATSGDCRVRGFHSPPLLWLPMRLALGLRGPRKSILGVEFAGEIEAVGDRVRRFKPGDRVFGMTGFRFGAYADYVCLPEKAAIVAMPDNASFEEAAALAFGGTTAMHFFRKGKLKRGHRALVYGASGAVGTSAVQLAKHLGAEVTGVCSGANAELVRSLGADHVIDYTKEDLLAVEQRYDLVFDAVGKAPKTARKALLAPNGAFATVDGQGVAEERLEDLALLKQLFESGELVAVVDRTYPLERAAEAHRYIETGRKKGNVVLT
ncbi:NAD(P)-dependent alcohol dehydrogenase [Paenibacillus sp. TRM 82003]|nr:NAD(P)-dependent alcohol dehydrogenase [Paenibacillus sp. TRM 82003]